MLRGMEIGNHPILKRSDSLNIFVCLFMHLHGLPANGKNLVGIFVDGDN